MVFHSVSKEIFLFTGHLETSALFRHPLLRAPCFEEELIGGWSGRGCRLSACTYYGPLGWVMGPYVLPLFAKVLMKSKDGILGRQTAVWVFLGCNLFFPFFFPGDFLGVFSGCENTQIK